MNDTRNEFERIMANHAVLSWSDSMGEYRSVATQKMWEVWQAARAQGGQGAEVDTVYVDCRECDVCGHAGINDSHESYAACHRCDWSGPEPEQDRCPGCDEENCMAAACPECSGCYVLIAEKTLTTQPQPAVPEGFALVPESMCLSYEDIESIITMTGWDEGHDNFGEGVLWVGALEDDDGNETYGLHISCIEAMEEGALPVQEFQKPELSEPAQQDPDLQLIEERDYWEEKATELAEDVGKLLGVEVGEHSSANCPVQNAIDAVFRAAEYPAQQGSVPEETEAMVDAACKVFEDAGARVDLGWLGEACRAYVAAAFTPTTPQADGWVKCHMETAAIALEALHFYATERFKGFGDDPEPYEHHLAQQAIGELQDLVTQPPAKQEGE